MNEALRQLSQIASVELSNQEIPVEKRWELFMEIPSWAKERWPWYCTFPKTAALLGEDPDELIMYDGVIHAEKYQTFVFDKPRCFLVEVIEKIAEEKGLNVQEVSDCFKEEVMAQNLYSFQYDW